MMERSIASIFVFLLAWNGSHAQELNDTFQLPLGKFSVGFRHYVQEDKTRTYQRIYDWNNKPVPRPISISIWYPGQENKNASFLSAEDFLAVLKYEEEWETLPNERILSWFYYPNNEKNRSRLNMVSNSQRELLPAEGKFPIILYAPSYEASSVENFIWCEFLASHGYIVIASPSRGPQNRFLSGDLTRDIEAQARDLEFLIGEISMLSQADVNSVAVAGFSLGGMSNVLVQMRNRTVKAIVCLDGTLKYHPEKLFRSPDADISRVDVPFLFMGQKDIPREILQADGLDPSINTNFTFFDSLRYSDAWDLKFMNLTHSNFAAMGILFQERDPRQDKTEPEIIDSYKWMSLYSLHFLNSALRGDGDSRLFLLRTTKQHGIENLVTVRHKTAKEKKFAFEDFNSLAEANHYVSLDSLYKAIVALHPSFKPDEWKMNNLGLQLLFKKRADEGLRVLEFNTVIYARSANAFDSLGEAYLLQGNNDMARRAFTNSLKLDPDNLNAISRLQHLKKR
jgi:hypothetical protein